MVITMTATLHYPCPTCGRTNESHAGPTPDSVPDAGDLSLCWKCRSLAIYTDNGLRLPTAEELAEYSQLPELKGLLGVMAETMTPSQAIEMRQVQGL